MGRWRRRTLEPGIYDELVSAQVARDLAALDPTLVAVRRNLADQEDLRGPLVALLQEALALALIEVRDKPADAMALAEELLAVLRARAPHTFRDADDLTLRPERLAAIVRKPASDVDAPRGSLHTSQLIVNATGESLLDHLRSEFATADRVDLLCAFVKLSGVEKFRRELESHCVARGRPLRVLTTTYMGASDAKAVARLAGLPNASVKVSFDEQVTRLHAKAWVFHRASGYSTAYVGSSNLSHAAQTDGLEWNVRVTEVDQPAVLAQMVETFEQYWADDHQFERYDHADERQRRRLARALQPRVDVVDGELVEIEPKDFQKPVLAELAEARRLGRHRNLVVAATGTGKTVMAALDYRALRGTGAVDSLLFVAHRREILEQARRVFRHALQVPSFGELLFDGHRPTVGRHVFASIDSLASADAPIEPAMFDMVVIDEAHHAAAASWEQLLARVRPRELVGLTGTPERADGVDYAHHFPRPWVGNLRLWNAIPHALVPFRYYLLDVEGVDLRGLSWRAGHYATEELADKLVGAAEIFVRRATHALAEHVARPDVLRALAFCATVRHAEAVSARLAAHGLRSAVLTGESPAELRRRARIELDQGHLQVLCVVDLYNEGVDLPNVNALFLFRPTESATVFLQQLGRGLRRAPDKSELVVFDLTGRQHLSFRFDQRLRALLGHTHRELHAFVKDGFGRLPAGCHFHFDEMAQRDVLDQLKRAVPTDKRGLVALVREPAHAALGLAEFLTETDVDLGDVYAKDRSWTLLRRDAGLDVDPLDDDEPDALAALHRLTHVGDATRLDEWQRLAQLQRPQDERARRVMRMLFTVLYGKAVAADDDVAWERFVRAAKVHAELLALVPVLRAHNAILAPPHAVDPLVPLALHGRYLGPEISAAFDDRAANGRFRDYYTGVEAVAGGRFDLLLVTLEKGAATKEHLRYRDFPLHERRFHWQSKARTQRTDREGRRHLHPQAEGCTPLLFVRERDRDRPGVTMAFRYLGPVAPDGDSGERPITIEWSLRYPMPCSLLDGGRIAS
ncbi:MAG: DUF3427 domain-containing protein [Deltaproteobacteria bacterium]|nr:DUF3427 domain-containing protein [Deltaproteobacteria bacterium]